MNKEIKQKWVDLLRNGGLEQTRGCIVTELNGKKSYCALGVLCLAADIPLKDANGCGNYGDISKVLRVSGKDTCDIWELNDDRGMTFSQIADYIEKNIL